MRNCFRVLTGIVPVLAIIAAVAAEPAQNREVVAFREGPPGTIVVKTGEWRLYYVMGEGRAIRYPVGVGKSGKRWSGKTFIDGKYRRPAWSPPREVKRDKPNLPDVIPGGSPRNLVTEGRRAGKTRSGRIPL